MTSTNLALDSDAFSRLGSAARMQQLSHAPVNRGTKRRENQELETNPPAGDGSAAAFLSLDDRGKLLTLSGELHLGKRP